MTAALGPADPLRSAETQAVLASARAAAAQAGVTRLADVTRLDRFGLPVWQAIRPMSRALSVHQGKGATDAAAQIGALLEAVESDAAERFDGEGPVCRFDALPEGERAPCFTDYARHRESPPPRDEPYRWVAAQRLGTRGMIHLPFDLVSLDLTRAVPSAFDRASNGVATGTSRGEAILAALHEFLERDAVTEWQARGLLAAMAAIVDLDSVPFAWTALWRERIAAAGAWLQVYRVPTLTGTPLFACEIDDAAKDNAVYRAVQGRGCHPLPEIALFKAIAEALQARVTLIAGSRDDQHPAAYRRGSRGAQLAFAPPRPAGAAGVRWDDIPAGPTDADAMAAALAQAGYPDVAWLELAAPAGLSVVRAFVCGLGSMRRRRRRPLS